MTQRHQKTAGISRHTYEQYPWRSRVRSPAGRVSVLTLWTAASAALVVGLVLESLVLMGASLVVWIPAMGAVNVLGGGINVIRGSELDERELRQREQAWALGHRFLSVVLVVAWVVASALEGPGAYAATLAGLALLHIAAPSLVLAVRARLPEPNDRY
jgi:hypothetical protein